MNKCTITYRRPFNNLAALQPNQLVRQWFKTKSAGQALRVSLVKPGAYLSPSYELKPTIVTTNRPFAEWSEVFPNAACVVSIVDRLVHHSEILVIEAESYRMREAKERAAMKKKAVKPRRHATKHSAPKQPA